MPSIGRLPNPPDPRDNNHPFSAHLQTLDLTALPLTKMWRCGTPRLDQGQHGYCVGFAGANWEQCYPTYTPANNALGVANYMACKAIPGEPWPGQEGTSDRFLAQVFLNQGRIGRYLWALSPLDLKNWILSTGPVMVGTDWFEGMFNPTLDGFVPVTGNVAGGHEYLIRGYDHWKDAYRFRNSWGEMWGIRGEAWIKRIDLENLIFNRNGDALAAIEKVPV